MAERARLLKEDSFGTVELVEDASGRRVRRLARGGRVPGSALVARLLAAREQRILARLGGIEGVPRPLGREGRAVFQRSWLEGRPLHELGFVEGVYFERLLALVADLHAHGVTHNDLAKEANLLHTPAGEPALVDFQLALAFPENRGPVRRRIFAWLCREDRRHVLKQKLVHRPDLVSDEERRAIARKSFAVRLWSATVMRSFHRATRGLGFEEGEGRRER